MPFNGSGTYTLPAGNPVVTNTTISSTVHNNTMSDIATALSSVLVNDGQQVITGAQDFNGNELILDVDGDTTITADTDDEIDIKVGGADDFKILANILRALSGSSIETDTINETTSAAGVTIDSVVLKDGGITANGTVDFGGADIEDPGISKEVLVQTIPSIVEDRLATEWTGASGENAPVTICTEGDYIYVGLDISPAKVVKINRSTMVTDTVWTGASGENRAHHMIIEGDYLYVSLMTSPGKVIKIDKSDMTTDDTWTGGAGENIAKFMTSDGTNIYACLYISPAKVIKMDIATLTTQATWTGVSGIENFAQGIVYDGVNLYVGLDLQPFEIVQVDPSTMNTVTVPFADNPYQDSARTMYSGSVERAGQALSLSAGDVIKQVDLLLDSSGSPTGTATVNIRKSSDDSIVGALGTLDVSTVPGTVEWFRFTDEVTIAATETHYILIEYSGGDASNYIRLRYDSSNRTNGDHIHYNGSYTTATGTDASIHVYPNNKFYALDSLPETYGNHCLAHGKIYATTYDDPAKLLKINKEDMTQISALTFEAGEEQATMPFVAGDVGLIPLFVDPGIALLVNVDTMTRLGSWTGGTSESNFAQLGYDGRFTYIPAATGGAGKVIRKILEPVEETEI